MSIWKSPLTLLDVNERAKNSFSDYLGISFTAIGDDFLTATLPITEKTLQPMGIMHGGVSCALAETVGSAAGNFCIDLTKQRCVGLEININHIRPVSCGALIATATPLHLGKKTQVWNIEIVNKENKRVAISRLTLSVIEIGSLS